MTKSGDDSHRADIGSDHFLFPLDLIMEQITAQFHLEISVLTFFYRR